MELEAEKARRRRETVMSFLVGTGPGTHVSRSLMKITSPQEND